LAKKEVLNDILGSNKKIQSDDLPNDNQKE